MPLVEVDLGEEADDLALSRGCFPESPCWGECWSAAFDDVVAQRDQRSIYRSRE